MAHVFSETDTFPPTINGVDDTDSNSAASLNPGPAALADRTRWLFNRSGSPHLIGQERITIPDASENLIVHQTWTTSSYVAFDAFSSSTVAAIGDDIEVELHGTVLPSNDGSVLSRFWVEIQLNLGGGGMISPDGANNPAKAPFQVPIGLLLGVRPFTLICKHTVGALEFGSFHVGIAGRCGTTANSEAMTLVSAISGIVRVWRPS